jgi:hypothetical protein
MYVDVCVRGRRDGETREKCLGKTRSLSLTGRNGRRQRVFEWNEAIFLFIAYLPPFVCVFLASTLE